MFIKEINSIAAAAFFRVLEFIDYKPQSIKKLCNTAPIITFTRWEEYFVFHFRIKVVFFTTTFHFTRVVDER